MKKKPTIYILIILVWLVCVGLLFYFTARIISKFDFKNITVKQVFIIILLCLNSLSLACLWFGSVKDFTFSVSYLILHRRIAKKYKEIDNGSYEIASPKVLLLYCTCNDFNSNALEKCMNQDYTNFKTIILDDSSKKEFINDIDLFCKEHTDVELIRRTDKSGFKAGNLNNCLKNRDDYDYFVVLDSDELIPNDYIKNALKYFAYNKKCGAVQAKHSSTKGTNVFSRLMGLGIKSNGESCQVIKNFYGANALIGHGMMISKECYQKTGGFPLVVAEDISFAVEIKNAGFDIMYSTSIQCYEEFPCDYVSLKKRQCKWVQGNLEYMKKYDSQINHSKMSWYEKLDIKLSHYSLPIVPILSFNLLFCTIILGFLGYPIINYSIVIYVMTFVFLFSSFIPDFFIYKRSRKILLLLPYVIVNIITYVSLVPMMLKTIFLNLIGKKAVFIVTPKEHKNFKFLEVIRYSYDSIIFGIIILILSYFSCRSLYPVALVGTSCILAPIIILLSNFELKEQK